MWILENEGEAFEGKRLWLRPGKRYLFGRTVAEPGQLAIKGEKSATISRKHVTISVDDVGENDGQNLGRRTKVTVEDLGSKIGTTVNGTKLKSEKLVLTEDDNELQMGSFKPKFRIFWFAVVLSFSFTTKELQADPVSKLRQQLEHLDVKFNFDYNISQTTHVVSRKRNTSKGLQALINGKHIVNDRFVDALVKAATPQALGDGVETSVLEGDFEANWPDALEYLPPPGNEPVPRPTEAFAPNPNRAELFDGYTFIFYNRGQYDSLLGPITNGKGKALFKDVIPHETDMDEFIRYVKEIAGEKGLGEFEDGSEGKGVVVVKFLPVNAEPSDWFSEFYTAVSLRLDHRLIDQKDFIDAILGNDASVLRRPLQPETQQGSQIRPGSSGEQPMQVNDQPSAPTQQSAPARRRVRGAAKSRFKGFDMEVDSDDDDRPASVPVATLAGNAGESSQEGLFVSQTSAYEAAETTQLGRASQRKRPAEDVRDVMEDFAPNAALAKRRRIERGESPVQRQASPTVSETQASAAKTKVVTKSPKVKKELDILGLARLHREEAQAAALAEREELATAPEGLDLAEIRRLQIEEPMEVRQATGPRTRQADIADGRWNPDWNGRKNFKKFQQRGTVSAARAPMRIIVPLEEVKSKGFGIGDDYWLEDEGSQRKKKSQNQSQSQSQGLDRSRATGSASLSRKGKEPQKQSQAAAVSKKLDSSDSEVGAVLEEDSDDDVVVSSTRSRTVRSAPNTASTQSQQTQAKTQPTRTTAKRPAAAPPPKQQPPKRPKTVAVPDSDDESEDELRFRFTKRK